MGKQSQLQFVPLGGVGEIGMNLALYGFGEENQRKWIMVDCGVTFPTPNLPGVDLVLPDISYVESLGDSLLAVVITHAHEDHYGALLSLWPRLNVPIYCTAFTAGMLEAKARYEEEPIALPLEIYNSGQNFTIGPFDIEPVYVTHSIPEPMALAINTPLGRIIHTGDWKLDKEPTLGRNTDIETFKRLGKDGVLALICDSTNAMREGVSPTERSVSDSLAGLIKDASGRVAITTFSSNVGRIRSIAQAAEKVGRKVMLVGSSIRRVVEVATDIGMFDDIQEFVEDIDFKNIPAKELVIILTGSQGESRAALAKIAREEHRYIRLNSGDTVIFSSRTIPGNEKPIIEVKNQLIEQGIKIIEDGEHLVHVSGHPRKHELQQMYEWTKPEILIPVHGEEAHLNAHARLGGESAIPQVLPVRNGDLATLAPGLAEISDQVPFGRIYKDGQIIGTEDSVGVRERWKLAHVGFIAISVVLDRHGEMADDMDIEIYGLPEVTNEGAYFDDILYKAALGALSGIPKKRRKDEDVVREAIRSAVRSEARNKWGKKPVATVFVARV
ncbi:MAG: ribonuclease J [Rhizobiaceae bacterium]|nr:ribonuclease J [Rhizobiaceae bacterium]